MTVYTGGGDEGETDLWGGKRISKAHPRIESYGTVDELNALLGIIRPTSHEGIDGQLQSVQHHLHVIQAELARPPSTGGDPRIEEEHVDSLEAWIDTCENDLEPLDSFVLPGGGEAGARLHHARTVCRRAERRVVSLQEREAVEPLLQTYLNRLSDLLFVQARLVNAEEGVPEEAPTY